ncbi:Rrf2 family transcriptional regulator [Kordiimonas sp.]|uniref:Rrf2 family transcriptional regulator n=1 Tax=Kordiimonas sp. TaxID=1970157 RepID=UPI003A901D70
MKRDSKLSGILHVLLHMAEHDGPTTSEALAKAMCTNPVVIRRIMAGLRRAGYVASEKGRGGGWVICRPLEDITLRDIYAALGSPALLAMGNRSENPNCLVEQAVNAALGDTFEEAETLILGRFGEVTLASLSADFHTRFKNHHRHHHGGPAQNTRAPNQSESLS